ncbi:hypothetical protein CVT26_013349 [Gymnopilus dilepis]|uniref:Uncharacterized protein n=1 Tax=Gymnopilus dilepis TaxID=231916 RepID=A0A409WV74_9AGAR|nr:hypothetical protein CVT26_013349 [Gymnopilus dilepis]
MLSNRAKTKKERKIVLNFLRDPHVQNSLHSLTVPDFGCTPGSTLHQLRQSLGDLLGEPIPSVERFGQLLNRARAQDPSLVHHVEVYWTRKKGAQTDRNLTRNRKKDLAHEIGLHAQQYYLKDRISVTGSPQHIEVGGLKVYLRKVTRDYSRTVRMHSVLSEVSDPIAVTVNADSSYETIGEDTSVIFYSEHESGQHAQLLYQWLYDVIVMACKERRNVRPDDEGAMVQIGLNTGPRNARVFGPAVSYTDKKLTPETKEAHDRDAIGAVSLVWGLARKLVPQEIIDTTIDQLEKHGFGGMMTRHVAPGKIMQCLSPSPSMESAAAGPGYSVQIGEKTVTFSAEERAPPEGYLLSGYTARAHRDDQYSPYSFALCVDRRPGPKENKCPRRIYFTRGAKKNLPEASVQEPPGGGSSFVDITLGVVVRQAQGTLLVIRPEHQHGTTKSYGMWNASIVISFSKRLADAWEKVKQNLTGIETFANPNDVESETEDRN